MMTLEEDRSDRRAPYLLAHESPGDPKCLTNCVSRFHRPPGLIMRRSAESSLNSH